MSNTWTVHVNTVYEQWLKIMKKSWLIKCQKLVNEIGKLVNKRSDIKNNF